MKRSELVTKLQEHINQLAASGAGYSANDIVLALESLGMQPPAIKEPCETFVLFNGQYVKTEDSFVFTSRWEDEAQ